MIFFVEAKVTKFLNKPWQLCLFFFQGISVIFNVALALLKVSLHKLKICTRTHAHTHTHTQERQSMCQKYIFTSARVSRCRYMCSVPPNINLYLILVCRLKLVDQRPVIYHRFVFKWGSFCFMLQRSKKTYIQQAEPCSVSVFFNSCVPMLLFLRHLKTIWSKQTSRVHSNSFVSQFRRDIALRKTRRSWWSWPVAWRWVKSKSQ